MIDELKVFIKKIENFENLKSSDQVDYFAFFLICEKYQDFFTPSQIDQIFKSLRILPYSNIPYYLTENSNKSKNKKKKTKFIKTKNGYHFLSAYENEIKQNIKEEEIPFINFAIDTDSLNWKPSDIPFINSKIRKSSDFFTKLYFLLYHLENSIRKLLVNRLSSIIGSSWESHILVTVDLSKAQSIRKETNLSEMIQDRGENILYYCMWEDYGKIIKQYPAIFKQSKESDEIIAHLNTLSKIRNAIAHNTATIPIEYQDELTLFLKKYIRIFKNNGS